jgi:hypothetical protein
MSAAASKKSTGRKGQVQGDSEGRSAGLWHFWVPSKIEDVQQHERVEDSPEHDGNARRDQGLHF